MTTTNIPSAEQLENMEADRNSIVDREDDEGVAIEIYVVRGQGVQETTARTYTRSFGHYFISPDSRCANILDELIAEYTSKNGILSNFSRKPFDGYEIMFEVNDIMSENGEFDEENKAEIKLTSQSEQIDKIDKLLSEIKSEITE